VCILFFTKTSSREHPLEGSCRSAAASLTARHISFRPKLQIDGMPKGGEVRGKASLIRSARWQRGLDVGEVSPKWARADAKNRVFLEWAGLANQSARVPCRTQG
jgi:hypothetical protein